MKQLAETFKPITSKLEKINESTKNLDPKYLLFQNQLPEGIIASDEFSNTTFAFMNKSKNFFQSCKKWFKVNFHGIKKSLNSLGGE